MSAHRRKFWAARERYLDRFSQWDIFADKAIGIFREIETESKAQQFNLLGDLYGYDSRTDFQYTRTGQNFVTLNRGWRPLSVIIKKDIVTGSTEKFDTVLEYGTQLLLTQSPFGGVCFLIFFAHSEIFKYSDKEYIIWKSFDEPAKIKDSDIENAIKAFFLCDRASSCFGNLSAFERIIMFFYLKKHHAIAKWIFDAVLKVKDLIPKPV